MRLQMDTHKEMILLACFGTARCARVPCSKLQAVSIFPYVSSNYRFLGLAYAAEFESKCWVISNLSKVTQQYRDEFVRTYDCLFALSQNEFENYAYPSEKLRLEFIRCRKRFLLLHRNGETYLVSPSSERLHRMDINQLPKFEPDR